MTIVVTGDDDIIEQIIKQIEKLVDVNKVEVLEDNNSVCRELILTKVKTTPEQRQQVMAVADIFRAKIVDVGIDSLIIELTGNQNKLDAFLNLLADYEILELVRTGITVSYTHLTSENENGESTTTETNILALSSVYMLDDNMNELVADANLEMFNNALSEYINTDDSVETLSIPSKSLQASQLTITASVSRLVGIIVAVVLLSLIHI